MGGSLEEDKLLLEESESDEEMDELDELDGTLEELLDSEDEGGALDDGTAELTDEEQEDEDEEDDDELDDGGTEEDIPGCQRSVWTDGLASACCAILESKGPLAGWVSWVVLFITERKLRSGANSTVVDSE